QAERASLWCLQAGRERIVQRRDRDFALSRRLAERGRSREPDLAVLRSVVVPRRPEQPVTAAKHRVGIDGEGGADARRRLDLLRAALFARAPVDAGVNHAALERLSGQQSRARNLALDRMAAGPTERDPPLVADLAD